MTADGDLGIVRDVRLRLVGTAAAQGEKPETPDAAVGPAFTYQGQIKRNGALFTGTCNMQFKLWDAGTAGTQQGSTLNVNAVSVNGGVFTVGLDFGNQFKGDARWLTPAQEQKFEDYVNAGGRLFLYHDGFGAYPKGNGVSRVARSYFIKHPAVVNIEVSPTGKMPQLAEGITPFTVADEEYEVEMDESQTSVFLESRSPEHWHALASTSYSSEETRNVTVRE